MGVSAILVHKEVVDYYAIKYLVIPQVYPLKFAI